VAGAVLVSALVSLTLTPMMCSKMLRRTPKHGRFFRNTEKWMNYMIGQYNWSLHVFFRRRWLSLLIMGLAIAIILFFGSILPSELAPLEDKGRLSVISSAPEGVSYELMDGYMQELLSVVDTIAEKRAIIAVTAPGFGASGSINSGFMRVSLNDPSERERSQQDIVDMLSGIVRKYSFARSYVVQEQTIGGSRGFSLPVQFVIQAPNFSRLRESLPRFMEEVQKSNKFQVTDLDLKFNKPELAVEIDRDRACTLGVNVRDVAESLQFYFSGQRFGFFILNNKQYQVIGQANLVNRDQPLDLSSIYIRNSKGEMIQMDNLVSLTEQVNPPQLYRYNRYVSATVSAQPATGVTLGQGIEEMQRIAGETLDETFSSALAGTSKEFEDSSSSLLFAFLLALVLIYLILAAQFESYRDPLIIMFTVPLALAGALLSLWMFGQTINIFSQIGVIVLIGIVTKNGILIVEFANQRKATGMDVKEAVMEAATRRLRPILMTSLATALGALPIAMALGAASRSRIPMGITIIGGLIFSLQLTLYVIPSLYTYLSKKNTKKSMDPVQSENHVTA
jgi:multidrug efflux pump